jgi:hypothetical protein
MSQQPGRSHVVGAIACATCLELLMVSKCPKGTTSMKRTGKLPVALDSSSTGLQGKPSLSHNPASSFWEINFQLHDAQRLCTGFTSRHCSMVT